MSREKNNLSFTEDLHRLSRDADGRPADVSHVADGGGDEMRRNPFAREDSRVVAPAAAALRSNGAGAADLNLSPCAAILHDKSGAVPNYSAVAEPSTPGENVKREEGSVMMREEVAICAFDEQLANELETSLHGSVSASQMGETQGAMRRAAFHIFKGNVGAGVFLLPTYYQDVGCGLGLIIVFLLGALMIDCALALVYAKQKINSSDVRTYPAVVGHVLGRSFMRFTQFALIFTQFGFCVVYIQYASSLFAALFSNPDTYRFFVFISILVVTPMTFFTHRMGLLAYASMLAAVFVVLVVGGAVVEESSHLATRGVANGTTFFLLSMRILVFISGHMFALEGIGVVLPVENSIPAADRPRFSNLVKYTLTSIVLLYVVFGVLGYLAFGEALKTSVLLAMPPGLTKNVLQTLLGLSLIFGYPIQYVPAIQLVDRILGISVHDSREMAYFVRILLNAFFGALAGTIGGDTLNIFASFLGAFTGVHLMITVPALLSLFTDHVVGDDGGAGFSSGRYVKLFFTRPDRAVECRWYAYLLLAMLVWVGGTYYTLGSVFSR